MSFFDPAKPRLKPRIAAGEPVGVVWLTLGSPTLAEVTSRHGPDALVIDMQHGLYDRVSMENTIGASAVPVLVRTRDDHDASIGEALDAGAEGVIVPLVESAAAASRVASACRYPPGGHRSGGGIRPLADFAAHVAHANAGVLAAVMIETAAGVEAADAIAASGVDMVFIGTGDLALSLGAAPGSEAHEAACQRILQACRNAGIPCGSFAMSAEAAAARIGQGFALSVASIDLAAYEAATAAALATFRDTAKPPAPASRAPARKTSARPASARASVAKPRAPKKSAETPTAASAKTPASKSRTAKAATPGSAAPGKRTKAAKKPS